MRPTIYTINKSNKDSKLRNSPRSKLLSKLQSKPP